MGNGSGGSESVHIYEDLLCAGTILGTAESVVNKTIIRSSKSICPSRN